MAEPTPGPWSIGHTAKGYAADWFQCPVHVGAPGINGGQGNAFAIVSLGGPGATRYDAESVEANARLMAAAPEMLAALRMVLDDPGLTASANDVIRAAIQKAEGT